MLFDEIIVNFDVRMEYVFLEVICLFLGVKVFVIYSEWLLDYVDCVYCLKDGKLELVDV